MKSSMVQKLMKDAGLVAGSELKVKGFITQIS